MNIIDDITTLDSLESRALRAYHDALLEKQAAEREIYEKIRAQMYYALVNTFGVDPGTVSAALCKALEGTKAASESVDHPSDARKNLAVEVRIDGIDFRGHFVQDEFYFEARDRCGNLKKLSDLATLGKVLS
jgi:hypothetical protein